MRQILLFLISGSLFFACEPSSQQQQDGLEDISGEKATEEISEEVAIGAEDYAEMSVAELLENHENLNQLQSAIDSAGLLGSLAENGPYTIFAPIDAAFEKLPEETVNSLLNNQDRLIEVVKYHIVPSSIKSPEMGEALVVNTMAQIELTINETDAGMEVNRAIILDADLQAKNGTVHLINEVLIPAENQ